MKDGVVIVLSRGTTMIGAMRIDIVTETFPPEVNGVATTLARFVDGLAARGHALRVLRPRQDRDPAEAPVDPRNTAKSSSLPASQPSARNASVSAASCFIATPPDPSSFPQF